MCGALNKIDVFKQLFCKLGLQVPESRPDCTDLYGPLWIAVTLIVECMFVGYFDNSMGVANKNEVKIGRVSGLIFFVFFWLQLSPLVLYILTRVVNSKQVVQEPQQMQP